MHIFYIFDAQLPAIASGSNDFVHDGRGGHIPANKLAHFKVKEYIESYLPQLSHYRIADVSLQALL